MVDAVIFRFVLNARPTGRPAEASAIAKSSGYLALRMRIVMIVG